MTDRPCALPIRVALQISDGPDHAYRVAAARRIEALDDVEVVLVLVTPARSNERSAERSPLQAVYERIEGWALRGGPRATAGIARATDLAGVRVERDGDAAARKEAMLASRPDVLVDLAGDGDTGLDIPAGGRWRLRFANALDGSRRRELIRPPRDGVGESLLEVELPTGQRFEAERGVSALRRIGFGRDRDAIYWRAATLPARHLARMAAGGGLARSPQRPATPPPRDTTAETEPIDRPAPFLGLARTLASKVAERLLFRTGWVVLTRDRAADEALPRDLHGFQEVAAPDGRFFADPFVVAEPSGITRLYVEDCPDGAHRGRISTLVRRDGGGWSMERTLLADLDHRAYPHVTRVPVGLVMTPDSGRAGGVDLFIDRGPDLGLELLGRCLEGVGASDPTLLWDDGRHWLFVAQTEHGMSPWDELHLYMATDLAGPWHPHPQNPVVADARRARPGGRIFRQGDTWIRPGQDCSLDYGRRVVFSAITTLTPTEYEEHPIAAIEPTGVPGITRTHTFSFDGQIEALDGYRRVPRLRVPRRSR